MTGEKKSIVIATFGDSLTQGNPPPEHRGNPGKYQSHMHDYLVNAGYEVDIRNHGIGGQLVGQVVNRIKAILPVDVVTIVAGTNDIWHFSLAGEGIEEEIKEAIIEELELAISIIREHPDGERITLILCSIPPFGNVKGLAPVMFKCIRETNAEIEKLCARESIPFCDVNKAMRLDGPDMYANLEFVVADGVHFTPAGNEACGLQLAKCIASLVPK
ncbi:MAG: SGNH/GDSL hydrolase family protein [Promethearchaeota archaeon]